MTKFNEHGEEIFLLIKDLIEDNEYKMTIQREEILAQFIKNRQMIY